MAEPTLPTPLASRAGDKIRFLFSRNNLTQASTIKAVIGLIAATGLVAMTPDQQQQAASLTLRFVDSLMNFLAAIQAAYAFVNFLYNERKHTTVNAISTIAPGAVIVESRHV